MNSGKYVFSQLIEFLPARTFDRFVATYNGNHRVRHFSCWNQLMVMIFGHLSTRDSLRDLLTTISAHESKFYHLGFGKGVSRSNLASANETRDWRIFADMATEMMAYARSTITTDSSDLPPSVIGNVYAFDATTIDLCLNLFWWASFRKTKAGIKAHVLYDVRTAIPCWLLITEALLHEVNTLDHLVYEAGGYYVLDRGYVDFARLYRIHCSGAFFVTRAKSNTHFDRRYSRAVDKAAGIRCDQTVMVHSPEPRKRYPDAMRRISYYDAELGTTLDFITNNFELEAIDITRIYRHRWAIETFFKWMKGHLYLRTFWGRSANAVKIQIYTSVITYTLIAIVRQRLGTNLSNYEMLQILGVSLFDKTHLNQLLQPANYKNDHDQNCNSLQITLF